MYQRYSRCATGVYPHHETARGLKSVEVTPNFLKGGYDELLDLSHGKQRRFAGVWLHYVIILIWYPPNGSKESGSSGVDGDTVSSMDAQ